MFEEGPKALTAFPPLKATAVWVSLPLPFPVSYLPCSYGQSSISSPDICFPGQSLTKPYFPVSKTEMLLPHGSFRMMSATNVWEAASSCSMGGIINTGSCPSHSPPSSPSRHVASFSHSSVSSGPQGPSVSRNFSSPPRLAFHRPPKNLDTRPVAFSAGKGGNNSPAHLCNVS